MNTNSEWIDTVVKLTPGYEREVFERYAKRLMAFASTRMPKHLSGRLDADDIVQSVFRSFFRRHNDGDFQFDDSHDLWQLLAAITFRKVVNASRFHHRDIRDAKRDLRLSPTSSLGHVPEMAAQTPGPEEVGIMTDYVEWILAQLPDHYQAVVLLRLEGLAIAEIADKQNLSQRTIKRVLAHVRDLAASRALGED